MRLKKIKDLQFDKEIVEITKTDKIQIHHEIRKTITLKTRKGEESIRVPKRLLGLKIGNKLVLIKLVRKKALENAGGNIFNIRDTNYTIAEWKQDGDYTTQSKNNNPIEYIEYSKALEKYLKELIKWYIVHFVHYILFCFHSFQRV